MQHLNKVGSFNSLILKSLHAPPPPYRYIIIASYAKKMDN